MRGCLQRPIAVFRYGDKTKSENVIIGLNKEGKQFVVGVHFNQIRRGTEVSDIRGLYPKDNAEWLNWISQGKAEWLDKEKIQTLIDQQRTNLAEVEYLDLDDVAKVINSFENPKLPEGESYEYLFRDGETDDIWKDRSVGLEERITNAAIRLSNNQSEDLTRVGKQRLNGNTTYLIQVTDSHDNTLFIELSKDGSYWGVNSGGVFRKGYVNKKETVAKTEPKQPNNAVSSGSSLSKDEQSGTSSIEPNGEPTVSKRKVSNSASDKQEEGAESSPQTSANKGGQTIQGADGASVAQVNTTHTPAQVEAGNYKKGHVTIGEFDITIENPAGSVRKGVDADGKEWSTQ